MVDNTVRVGGKNITLDKYFTSLSIVDWCLERNITVTGICFVQQKSDWSLTRNESETGRVEKLTKWCCQDKNMLIVIALTTMHATMRVSKDERRKPEALVYYDYMKGGVDVVDLVSTMLSTRVKNKHWPLNALTLYNEINRERLSNFEFT